MFKTLIGQLVGIKLLAPDDGSGDGGVSDGAPGAGEGVADPNESQGGGGPGASTAPPPGAGAPAPQPPESQFDPRSAYEQLAQQNAQYQQALQQMHAGIQESNKRWGDLQGIFKKMAGVEDPKVPEWQGPMQQMYGSMKKEMQNFFMEQRLRDELPQVEKAAPELFKIFGPEAQRMVMALWTSYADKNGNPHRSILETAKMLNEPYKKALDSALSEQQKQWVQGKQNTQQRLKGSGPAGTPPPPTGAGPQDKNKPRGFEAMAITDDDVRQVMDELKGTTD